MHLKCAKCAFLLPAVEYLHHNISAQGDLRHKKCYVLTQEKSLSQRAMYHHKVLVLPHMWIMALTSLLPSYPIVHWKSGADVTPKIVTIQPFVSIDCSVFL